MYWNVVFFYNATHTPSTHSLFIPGVWISTHLYFTKHEHWKTLCSNYETLSHGWFNGGPVSQCACSVFLGLFIADIWYLLIVSTFAGLRKNAVIAIFFVQVKWRLQELRAITLYQWKWQTQTPWLRRIWRTVSITVWKTKAMWTHSRYYIHVYLSTGT